jgi:hypothetical protein
MPPCSAHGRAATTGPAVDIDIMIEIDPQAHIGVFDYAGLKDHIAEFFDAPVDVVSRLD